MKISSKNITIKRFNENINDLDPFGEEIWGDLDNEPKENYPNVKGVCVNCGTDEIIYTDSENNGDHIYYGYVCGICNTTGEEVYEMVFVQNRI